MHKVNAVSMNLYPRDRAGYKRRYGVIRFGTYLEEVQGGYCLVQVSKN